jgi:formylglycine-generating enzyme required for sulfatase activity
MLRVAALILAGGVLSLTGLAHEIAPATAGTEVTIKGSMVCNGACIPDPIADDHVMVVYAIDGTADIRVAVENIMAEFYPDKGLNGDAAGKLLNQFTARLKYYVSPDSPALQDAKTKKNHYCMPAAAKAVTGIVSEKDGQRWITAIKIASTKLNYPDKMLAPDKPFAMPAKEPLLLKINDKTTLKCVWIPPGRFLMGTPFYMWPYFMEEFPHMVTLTKPFYMSEIPITQAMYEAVMGNNPSTAKDPQLPVQDPPFADVRKFCQILSKRNRREVRLPTDAEWEYAARVGTSNPGFAEKYQDQNSSGSDGFKSPLKVKSKQPNAWGLYDMASCWWEISGDKGMYNVRHSEVDPHYPPVGPDTAKTVRSGRGILQAHWSICTHEFIREKGYAGHKFRVVVEAEATTP